MENVKEKRKPTFDPKPYRLIGDSIQSASGYEVARVSRHGLSVVHNPKLWEEVEARGREIVEAVNAYPGLKEIEKKADALALILAREVPMSTLPPAVLQAIKELNAALTRSTGAGEPSTPIDAGKGAEEPISKEAGR